MPTKLPLVAWFAFMWAASLWLPAYKGDAGDTGEFAVLYALVAGLALLGVSERARSVGAALLSALPVVSLLALAAIVGWLNNDRLAGTSGEPLLLYYGVALWGSWAVLVLGTAAAWRTKWSGFAGIGVGLLVAVAGLLLFTPSGLTSACRPKR